MTGAGDSNRQAAYRGAVRGLPLGSRKLTEIAIVASLSVGCGRTEVFDTAAAVGSFGPDRVCLELCLEAKSTLEQSFGILDACTEIAWSSTALECAACNELFLELYGVEIEISKCRDCRSEFPTALCGTPPPECPLGFHPGFIDCPSGSCGECQPSYSGECVPCP